MTEGDIKMTKTEVEKKIATLKQALKDTMHEYEAAANGYPFYKDTDDEKLKGIKAKFAGLRAEMDKYADMIRYNTYDTAEQPDEYTEFPVLVGNEKQIAWANEIRDKFFSHINEEIKSAKSKDDMNALEYYLKWGNDYIKITSAAWWIEHRYEAELA